MSDELRKIEAHLQEILCHTTLFAGEHLTINVIINPCAGAFSLKRRIIRVIDELHAVIEGLADERRNPTMLSVRFHPTEYPGHALELSRDLIGQTAPGPRVIVSAGGDGTHDEVLSAAVGDSRVSGDRPLVFFRFPFGTGNDGADADTIAEACRVLLGHAETGMTSHLVVRRSGAPPLHGFNIASIGLDAYVALLTNKLKGSIAGDLYKVLADVMTLLYERIVGVNEMTVRWSDENGQTTTLRRKFVLCAFGVSGERSYGDHKPILPGKDNLCAIETIGLIGKVLLKGQVYRGEHVNAPAVHMARARHLTVEYGRRVPLQIDGETRWLEPEEFPLEMEVFPDSVPILKPV